MSELKSFVLLQARLYEFLAQQDETTLQAIVSGAAELAVLRTDDARAPDSFVPREEVRSTSRSASADPTRPSSDDPYQAARDLSELTSEQERRLYLNATGLPVAGLRQVAKLRGLARYSRLSRAKLINLLVSHGLDQPEVFADQAKTPTPPSSESVDSNSEAEPQATPQEAEPSTAAPSAGTATPTADVAAIASRLRETETEEEGAAYLHALRLDREALLAVAAELLLTRVDRLSRKELEKRVLKQAIGARRKFAGLRKW
ncbi:hypothetical protein [Amycolatopsis sp. NPDC059021]|uniref:hypothetical protein n=1 Tax=Amycolatopsis sp. NPDC059021 TaxID=3346704 RepID=UPI00366F7E2C